MENWQRVQNGQVPHQLEGIQGKDIMTYHKLYKVTSFEIVGDYTIRVEFDDNTEQTINFKPVLYGEMWGPLQNLTLFNQVELDSVAHTLTWPNGADFDPETLRNWPEYVDQLVARVKQWARVKVQFVDLHSQGNEQVALEDKPNTIKLIGQIDL